MFTPDGEYYGDLKHVLSLTSAEPGDFDIETDEEFKRFISKIMKRLSVQVNARMKVDKIDEDSRNYLAICDVVERKTIDVLSVSMQLQTGDIVSIDELTTHVINTTDAIRDLSRELKPLKESKIGITWTGKEA